MENGEQEQHRRECREYRKNWVLLVLGALEPDLQEKMGLHLRECRECAMNFLASEEVEEAISTVTPDTVVPVLETLVEQKAAARQKRPFKLPAPPAFVPWLLLAAATVCLLVVGRERDLLVGERSALEYLSSHDVGHLDLSSVHPGLPEAAAHAVWSPESGLLFVADHLPPPPQERCYQLWLLRSAPPVVASAGLVRMGPDGRATLFVPPGEPLRHVTGLAVTEEPAGGSAVSRGQRLMVGTR